MNKVMEKVPVDKTDRLTPVHKGWQSFDNLREEVDRMFMDVAHGFWRMPDRLSVVDGEFWPRRRGKEVIPPVDVIQKDHAYEVMVELPGLDEKEVEVKYADGMLTITGEKKEETTEEKKGLMVSERRHGSFERSLRVPEKVDLKKIEARFEKGVLTVVLPLRPEARSDERKISVKAA